MQSHSGHTLGNGYVNGYPYLLTTKFTEAIMGEARATQLARVLITSGTILATAVVLTGCGTQVTGGTPEDTTLTYWSAWSEGEPQQLIFADIISDFEKDSGITVDVRWLGRDYISTVENANAVGDGPDIYDSGTDHIAEFRDKDAIAPMESVLDEKIPGEDVTVGDVLSDSAIAASSDDEGLGLIPHTIISTAVWFDANANPAWVDSPPATFDDFLAAAEDIKASGKTAISQDGNINFYNAYWFYWLQMRHGGPGTLAALGADAAAWDDPSVLAAATDVERLVAAGLFEPDYMATQYPAAQNAWAAGDSTFELNGSWLGSETAANLAEGFEPATFQFPAVDGGHNSVDVGTLGWTINAQGKNPEEAAQFLAYSMQSKYIERISTEALNISARSDVDAPAPLVALQAAITAADEVNKTYDEAPALHSGWWNDVFLALDDKLLSGEFTAADFVSQGKQQTADYLKNN
ncbi:MAG: ABC transporter substrate-binding protein [Rhodoglobus sp.]